MDDTKLRRARVGVLIVHNRHVDMQFQTLNPQLLWLLKGANRRVHFSIVGNAELRRARVGALYCQQSKTATLAWKLKSEPPTVTERISGDPRARRSSVLTAIERSACNAQTLNSHFLWLSKEADGRIDFSIVDNAELQCARV